MEIQSTKSGFYVAWLFMCFCSQLWSVELHLNSPLWSWRLNLALETMAPFLYSWHVTSQSQAGQRKRGIPCVCATDVCISTLFLYIWTWKWFFMPALHWPASSSQQSQCPWGRGREKHVGVTWSRSTCWVSRLSCWSVKKLTNDTLSICFGSWLVWLGTRCAVALSCDRCNLQ